MPSFLIVLKEGHDGNERSHNGLRLAMSLQKKGAPVKVLPMGDAVTGAKGNQPTSTGIYNIERKKASVALRGAAAA